MLTHARLQISTFATLRAFMHACASVCEGALLIGFFCKDACCVFIFRYKGRFFAVKHRADPRHCFARCEKQQHALWCTKNHKSAHFSMLHTDAQDRLGDRSMHHKPSKHKCFPAFSQHGAIRRGAFRLGAHGDPRLRAKKIAVALGVPQSTTKRWLQRLRLAAAWRRTTSGQSRRIAGTFDSRVSQNEGRQP